MFTDHSLMPREVVRLAALGLLAEGPMRYGELASAVRAFISYIVGPSPETMGSSLELLRYEGLATQSAGDGEPVLSLTDKGRGEFHRLMEATVRTPFDDLNKVVVALKLRFFALLSADERREQGEILAEACRIELVRLTELRARNAARGGAFLDWLDHEIGQSQDRLAWFEALGRSVPSPRKD